MLRLRPYKSCDAKIIEKWIRNKDVFTKWGGTIEEKKISDLEVL